VRQTIKKILIEDKGKMIIWRTPAEKVNSFIEKLFPLKTDKELIRLGPNGDGGYLVPDDLKGIAACFSPGVDSVSEFEHDCLERGMKIYMADRTVDKPNLNIAPEHYHFLKKHIGYFDDDDQITLDSWVDNYEPGTTDLLLQMDIEGAEYYSILNASEKLMRRFRIIVIEFHDLHELWYPYFFNLADAAFNKLLHTHSCVHIHPNNYFGEGAISTRFGVNIPTIAEFTFYRNDLMKVKSYQKNFPHRLDYDNTDKVHVPLPKNWYRADS
jgi:hypothetical protein